ncbi:MAG: MBL fold metallo-hydrolase [Verrucomicrobiota bacterium]
MKIHFLGGVDTVTGSRHLVEADGTLVLCDCGLFQGHRKQAREINSRFNFDPARLNAAVVSHAHVDHCGNVPTLVQQGYRNPIYSTTATAALCEIMLRDAAHIQEQDAAYLNQKKNRKGMEPVVPLYTVKDTDNALALFRGYSYGERVQVAPRVSVDFSDAGHILGAALTTFTVKEDGRIRRMAFAVDLGRDNLPLIRNPEVLRDIDALVMESTYGDRLHDPALRADDELCDIVTRTYGRGGKVLIPSFALERAQEVIFHLEALVSAGRLPVIPVYVDSPMAAAVAAVFEKNREYLDKEFQAPSDRIRRVMRPKWLRYVSTVEESKSVTASDKPCIVIAGSGMCEHGRILHHLKHGIENPKNTIAFVGFQAVNTLGRRLVEGETKICIFGDWFERKAEVVTLNAFSAHADRDELIDYVRRVRPRRVYLVHGEPEERKALAEALRQQGLAEVHTPSKGEVVEL